MKKLENTSFTGLILAIKKQRIFKLYKSSEIIDDRNIIIILDGID